MKHISILRQTSISNQKFDLPPEKNTKISAKNTKKFSFKKVLKHYIKKFKKKSMLKKLVLKMLVLKTYSLKIGLITKLFNLTF